MSTLALLRAAVRLRTDSSANDTGLTSANVDAFVNAALKHIALAADWEWLDAVATGTVTAGNGAIAAQADLGRVQYLVWTDTGEQVRRVARVEVAQIPTTARGRPSVWSFDGSGAIEVRPVPDATYPWELRYYKTEPALSGDGNSPLIPTAYDDGVIEYAAYLCFRFLHRLPEAREAREAYNAWFRGARDDQTRVRGGFRVRVRPGSFT